MKLYQLTSGTSDNGYVYASGYGPLKSMPFLPSVFLDRMNKYWKVNPEEPGLDIEPGRKRQWPDFMYNGHSPPMYFISEKVIHDLKTVGIEFYRITQMPIAIIHGKWHKNNTAPKYYVAEIEIGGIEQDYIASGYDEFGADGTPTREAIVRRPAFTKNVYTADTWNGKDLFSTTPRSRTFDTSTTLFCTEKVKTLGEKSGWVNVEFEQLELV